MGYKQGRVFVKKHTESKVENKAMAEKYSKCKEKDRTKNTNKTMKFKFKLTNEENFKVQ